MKQAEFYEILNAVAPKTLSDEYCEKYGAYDNSGVLISVGEQASKAVFSLDFSLAAIQKAIESKADVLVTHHPAIYGKIGEILIQDTLGEKIALCIQNGISVMCMHLNLDGAIGGVDESLAFGVCQSAKGASQQNEPIENLKIRDELSVGGYGRAYDISPVCLQSLVENMKKTFQTDKLIVYGDVKTEINRVASFCGAGGDESAVDFAIREGANVVISSDFKHHVLAYALERGLCVIALTHYAAENYGFEKFYQKVRSQTNVECLYHTDERLL